MDRFLLFILSKFGSLLLKSQVRVFYPRPSEIFGIFSDCLMFKRCFLFRYTKLTPSSSDVVSIVGSIAEQICYLTKTTTCEGPHVCDIFTLIFAF